MARSQRLKLSAVRDLFRLLGEVRELAPDPLGWRRHMLHGLCRLTGTQVGISSALTKVVPDEPTEFPALVTVGWAGAKEQAVWDDFAARGNVAEDPTLPALMKRWGTPFTLLREQMLPDDQWYRNEHVNVTRRSAGVDAYLNSQYFVSRTGMVNGLALFRPWGETRIGEAERRLVHLFHLELGRLWEAPPADESLAKLSRRQRQTLSGLMRGRSEKQIAADLHLSQHTVHEYVQTLYRRLGVSSNVELVTRVNEMRSRLVPRMTEMDW